MTGSKPTAELQENLISQTKISSEKRSSEFWKGIGLDIFSVGFAALFGMLYYRYLTGGAGVFFLLGALTLYGVVSGLQAFLTKGFGRRCFVIFLEIVALVGFFFRDDWHILIATAIVLFVFLVWGYSVARRILQNSIEVPFFHASKSVLGSFLTGVLAFMILAYVPTLQGSRVVIPDQSFRLFFDWVSGLAESFYPNIALTGSFSDFASSVAKMELANNPNFQSLNPQAQTTAIAQAAAQLTTGLSQNLPAPIAPSVPVSDAFYKMVTGMFAAWQSQAPIWFAAGWAVSLFLVLRGLGILFMWFVQIILVIVYEILIASGLIQIREETQVKEVVGY